MRRSYLTLVAVCSFWGTIPLLAQRVELPPVAIVFVRVWVAAIVLAVVLAAGRLAGVSGDSFGGSTGLSHPRLKALVAGLLLAVHWTAMFAGYQQAPDDTVVFIIFLAPVGVAVLAPRALGEHAGGRTLLALGAALVGLALVAGPSVRGADQPLEHLGIAWAALSAATFVGLVLVSKPLAAAYGALRLTFVEMVVAGIALVPVAATAEWGQPRAAWAWLGVLGVCHTAVGITLYLRALARVPATHVGILGYLEPVVVVLLAWAVLGEDPRPTTVLGGLLIIAAGVFIVMQPQPGSAEIGAGVAYEKRAAHVPGR